jgi:hypothetical protein
MSSARPPANPQLDQLLSHARQPDLPAGLAARIVAQTAGLPQQARREDIVAQVPVSDVTAMSAAANENPWMRRGLFAGGVVAAVALAVVMAPSLLTRTSIPSDVARTKPASAAPSSSPVAPAAEQLADAVPSSSEHLAHPKHKPAAPTPDRLAAPTPATDLAAPVYDQADSPAQAAAPEQSAAAERVAQVDGPKAPVQGPPVPFDLIPSSSGTLGLGVAGSVEPAATTPPPSNAPGRGPGGPGGGFGGRGGGGRR